MNFISGTIIIIDIDRMGEIIEEKGWSEWRPNPATGTLSHLVEQLARKWNAVIVYGLDWERGTEEAVLEVPLVEPDELINDLVMLAQEVCRQGATVTIVAITAPVLGVPARNRREAYQGHRRRAKRLLESFKRKGGGYVVVDGVVVARLSPSECAVGQR